MQEADVARQLIADLQANAGIIAIFIILLLLLAIVRLASTLGNASRALRRVNDIVTDEAVARLGAAGTVPDVPRFAALKSMQAVPSLAGYRSSMRYGDILSRRGPATRAAAADTDRGLSPRPLYRRKII